MPVKSCKKGLNNCMNKTYFAFKRSYSNKSYCENEICGMLDILIGNVFVYWWTCFSTYCRHSNGGQLCTLFADLVLYSNESDFIQSLPAEKRKKNLAESFSFTFCCIDDVISLINFKFGNYVDRIYPIELVFKNTTDIESSAFHLDFHLELTVRAG